MRKEKKPRKHQRKKKIDGERKEEEVEKNGNVTPDESSGNSEPIRLLIHSKYLLVQNWYLQKGHPDENDYEGYHRLKMIMGDFGELPKYSKPATIFGVILLITVDSNHDSNSKAGLTTGPRSGIRSVVLLRLKVSVCCPHCLPAFNWRSKEAHKRIHAVVRAGNLCAASSPCHVLWRVTS